MYWVVNSLRPRYIYHTIRVKTYNVLSRDIGAVRNIFLGFLVAYMTSRTDTDETVVVSNVNALLSSLVDGFFVLLDTVRGSLQSAVVFVVGNVWRLLLLATLVSMSLVVYYGEYCILNTMDRMIRRIVYPFMQVGVWQVMHVVKFLYGTFVPIYNFIVVANTQLTTGMYTIVGKWARSRRF